MLLKVDWIEVRERTLTDLPLEAGDIKDTTSWEKIRTKENLAEFLEAFAKDTKKLEEAPKANGAPHTLIVTSAGMRAADLVRHVSHDMMILLFGSVAVQGG